MTTTQTTSPTATLDNGPRDFNAGVLLRQIGRMNVLAISGGRVIAHENGIVLPVRYGYKVEVFLAADDTYTVQRTHTSGTKRTVKAERTGVYAEDVADAAYRASCYRDAF